MKLTQLELDVLVDIAAGNDFATRHPKPGDAAGAVSRLWKKGALKDTAQPHTCAKVTAAGRAAIKERFP